MSREWKAGDVVDGRYSVLKVHDDGAMGLVYKVRHREWNAELAMKCPRQEFFQTPEHRERFVAEAENWVSLGLHPHVCSCYYVRVLEGVPQVFAEYVSGGSLGHRIGGPAHEGAWPLSRILDVAIQTAWGLSHAHMQGLVHRDVKPDNILIDDQGAAKVTDFGLAGALAGTDLPSGWYSPQFASPEQLDCGALDHRTDIYSFAVSVLTMFTRGAVWTSGLEGGKVLADFRADSGTMPGLLGEILARCLDHDPARRPRSMEEVSAGLIAVFREELSEQYPRPWPKAAELRASELSNRALSLMDLGRDPEAREAFTQALSADPEHPHATYNEGLARWRAGECSDADVVRSLEVLNDGSATVRHLLSEIHLERGDLTSAGALLSGLEGDPTAQAALRTLRSGRLPDASCLSVTRFPWQATRTWETSMLDIRLRKDGRFAVNACDDGPVKVWNLETGACTHVLKGHSKGAHSADLSPDGRFAVSSANDAAVRYWDLSDGRCLRTFTPRGPKGLISPREVRITSDARHALGAGRDGEILVWDFPDGRLLRTLKGHLRDVMFDVAAHPRLVLSSGNEDPKTQWKRGEKIESAFTVRLWDLETGQCLLRLPAESSPVKALRISDDGCTALVARYDQSIELLDLDAGRRLALLVGHPSGFPSSMYIGPDGLFALSGGLDKFGLSGGTANAVRLWDLKQGRCLRTFDGHTGKVDGVALIPGEPRAVSVSSDDTARVWRLPGRYTAPYQLSRPQAAVKLTQVESEVAALVADARRAMAQGDHSAALAKLTKARGHQGHERAANVRSAWRELSQVLRKAGLRGAWKQRTLEGHTSAVFSVAVSRDAAVAVSGDLEGTARIWDLGTGECLHVLPQQTARLRDVAVSQDGSRALTACADGTLTAWSATTGERLASIDGRTTHGAEPAAFDPSGRFALSGAYDGTIKLWDLEEGQMLRRLEGYLEHTRIHGTDLHLESGRAVSSASDCTVRLWDLVTGRCLLTMTGHTHEVMDVSISPDGTRALSCGGYSDTTVRLWDLTTGRCVKVMEAGGVRRIAFSPDGSYAVAAGERSAVGVWDLASGTLLRTLDGHAQSTDTAVMTSDACALLSGGSDHRLCLWELDWNLVQSPNGQSAR
ncbi:protein kinase [Streptomyces canus]|uniref:protein kinase domain-containing protein n=1 Tax=Streptomyces canus TaxID=58343 RepID=UPI0033D5B7C4